MTNDKDNKATGFIYEPMPSTMNDEAAERRTRDKVERLRASICNHIRQFREAGVTVADEEELRQLTPTAVRDQIAQTRKRRLGEKFLPASIRKAEEKAFAQMERTLVPLAANLQEALKSVPFSIHVGASEGDTYFNSDAVEDYIEKVATVDIPLVIRDYYEQLQAVCEAWHNLCQWCAANSFEPPTSAVLNALCHDARPGEGCTLSLTPERMLQMYSFGILRKTK